MTIQAGDTVMFKGGAIHEQARWASTEYPSHLIVGKHYIVDSVEILPWCTRLTLRNKQGTFNSVHFQQV